jgi:hypothetical protein
MFFVAMFGCLATWLLLCFGLELGLGLPVWSRFLTMPVLFAVWIALLDRFFMKPRS